MGSWKTKTLEQSLKEEREKTIKKVCEFLIGYKFLLGNSFSLESAIQSFMANFSSHYKDEFPYEGEFLPPDPVEELANELIINVDVNDGCSHEIAKHILDNYELKKKNDYTRPR